MMHPCEDQIILKSINQEMVPFFNAPIFLENKTQVGKVDEIFGQIKEYVGSHFVCLLSKKNKFFSI